jgi:hypothetical protein
MSHEERSEALIDVLDRLEHPEIPFVLVGGYAIIDILPPLGVGFRSLRVTINNCESR